MAPLTLVVMVMTRLTFKSLFLGISISGSYLACLCSMAWSWYLSWQYVKFVNWSVCVGRGV